jgi:hypothetical protein
MLKNKYLLFINKYLLHLYNVVKTNNYENQNYY